MSDQNLTNLKQSLRKRIKVFRTSSVFKELSLSSVLKQVSTEIIPYVLQFKNEHIDYELNYDTYKIYDRFIEASGYVRFKITGEIFAYYDCSEKDAIQDIKYAYSTVDFSFFNPFNELSHQIWIIPDSNTINNCCKRPLKVFPVNRIVFDYITYLLYHKFLDLNTYNLQVLDRDNNLEHEQLTADDQAVNTNQARKAETFASTSKNDELVPELIQVPFGTRLHLLETQTESCQNSPFTSGFDLPGLGEFQSSKQSSAAFTDLEMLMHDSFNNCVENIMNETDSLVNKACSYELEQSKITQTSLSIPHLPIKNYFTKPSTAIRHLDTVLINDKTNGESDEQSMKPSNELLFTQFGYSNASNLDTMNDQSTVCSSGISTTTTGYNTNTDTNTFCKSLMDSFEEGKNHTQMDFNVKRSNDILTSQSNSLFAPKSSSYDDLSSGLCLRYKLCCYISKSENVIVSLVINNITKKRYVIKVIKLDSMSRTEKESVQLALRLQLKLQHLFTLKPIDVFYEKKTLNIVTDYCSQGLLAEKIKNRLKDRKFLGIFKGYSERQIGYWLGQVALFIAHAHESGYIMRNLSTKTILIASDRSFKIMDFKYVCEIDYSSLLRLPIGKEVNHLAPELLRGESYSAAADLWSVGCILYELCTLKSPFSKLPKEQRVHAIKNRSMPKIPFYYSKELKKVYRSLCDKDPDTRICAQELLETPFVQKYLKEQFPLKNVDALFARFNYRLQRGATSYIEKLKRVTRLICLGPKYSNFKANLTAKN